MRIARKKWFHPSEFLVYCESRKTTLLMAFCFIMSKLDKIISLTSLSAWKFFHVRQDLRSPFFTAVSPVVRLGSFMIWCPCHVLNHVISLAKTSCGGLHLAQVMAGGIKKSLLKIAKMYHLFFKAHSDHLVAFSVILTFLKLYHREP